MFRKLGRRIVSYTLAVLFVLLVAAFSGCFGGKKTAKYELGQDVSCIESAEITVIESEEAVSDVLSNTESAHTLSMDDAQALAEKISGMDCGTATPPVHELKGPAIIFRYTDGSAEIIAQQSRRYFSGGKETRGCCMFEPEEFAALVQPYIGE